MAKEEDKCIHDPDQKLVKTRGIEIGHIFQLGKKIRIFEEKLH